MGVSTSVDMAVDKELTKIVIALHDHQLYGPFRLDRIPYVSMLHVERVRNGTERQSDSRVAK